MRQGQSHRTFNGQRRTAFTASVTAATALALLAGCGGPPEQEQPDMPPPPVTVEEVSKTSIDVEEDYAGRVRGAREVSVMARVDGILEERKYDEGELVEQGDVLFRIEQEPYEVALESAEAEKATAQADFNQAEREWNRISRLYDQNAVSERERDTARSAFELSRAALAVAEAGVRRAELELSYTEVKAPVSGVTSLEAVSEGNLLDRGAELAHITQLDPVHVRFSLPENDATIQREARKAMQEGDADDSDAHQRDARLLLPDGTEYDTLGTLDFTASTIDPQTGTVTSRAVFPNEEQLIVPGQFVRVRVTLETLDDVILLPEKAIGDGPQGLQVFVVDDEDKAHARPVETGRVVDGKIIIRDGLEEGERVVVEGMAGVQQDGMTVEVFESEEELEEAQQEAEAEAEQEGGAG